MSKKLYEESNIQEIASTIREKNGTQDTYKVSQMAEAMSDLIGPPVYNNMILAQDTQPTSEYNKVWFDTDADDEYTFPEIDDNNVSANDTWSSEKIKAEDDNLKSAITQDDDNLSQYNVPYKISSGTWVQQGSSNTGMMIPVSPGDLLILKKGTYDGYYAFLTNISDLANGATVHYSSGTGIKTLSGTSEVKQTIPNDTYYVFFYRNDSGTNRMPSKIKINGYEMLRTIKGNIVDARTEINALQVETTENKAAITDVNNKNECLFDNYTKPIIDEALLFMQNNNLYNGIYDNDQGLKADGTLESMSGYATTDFIPVRSGKTVYLSRKLGGDYGQTRTPANAARYALYNKYKEKIASSTSYWQNNIPITDGAYYLKVTVTASYCSTYELEASYKYANLSGNTNPINSYGANKAKAKYGITNLVKPIITTFASEWSAQGGTVSVDASEESVKLTGSGGAAYPILTNNFTIPYKKGHTYYCRFSVKTENNKCKNIAVQPLYSVYGTAMTIGEVCEDHWYTFSWFITPTQDGESCAVPIRAYCYFSNAADATGVVLSIKAPHIIDTEDLKPGMKLYQIDALLNKIGKINRTVYADIDEYLKDYSPVIENQRCFQSPQRTAMVTFVADDGYYEDYRKMHVLSERYGVPMCQAVASGMAGSLVQTMQMLYAQNYLGWEFASHTYSHVDLSTKTETEIIEQCEKSKYALESEGVKCTSIVYPYGGSNELVRRICKKYFNLGVTTSNGHNTGIIPSFYMKRRPLGSFYAHGTWEEYKGYVDDAIADNAWLIFMLHPNNANHDAAQQALFEQTIQYILQNNVPVVTLREGYQYFGNAFEAGDYTGEGTGVAISMTGEVTGIS